MEHPEPDKTCLSCQNKLTGNYCNYCGEKLIGPEDRKLKVLLGEFVNTLFNVDNKLFKTLWLIIRNPGQLSENYALGKRKPFFRPSSLYVLMTVIYFVFTPFEIFVPTLRTHTTSTNYATYAEKKVQSAIVSMEITEAQFEQRYKALAPGVAKWLILLYIPVLGLILLSLFLKQRPFVIDHFLLSTEINVYNIFVHFLVLPFFIIIFMLLNRWTINSDFVINDSILMPLIGLSFMRFFLLSFRRFYRQKWWIIVLKSIVFIVALGSFAFIVYRFLLFWITLQLV